MSGPSMSSAIGASQQKKPQSEFSLASNVENLTLVGTNAITVAGNTADNILIGNNANNTLTGNAGNGTISGGQQNDTYHYNIGDGIDTIIDNGLSGFTNIISFCVGITSSMLQYNRVGDNLVISFNDNADTITVNGWYANTANQIEQISFADGSSLNAVDLQSLTSGISQQSAAASSASSTMLSSREEYNPDITPVDTNINATTSDESLISQQSEAAPSASSTMLSSREEYNPDITPVDTNIDAATSDEALISQQSAAASSASSLMLSSREEYNTDVTPVDTNINATTSDEALISQQSTAVTSATLTMLSSRNEYNTDVTPVDTNINATTSDEALISQQSAAAPSASSTMLSSRDEYNTDVTPVDASIAITTSDEPLMARLQNAHRFSSQALLDQIQALNDLVRPGHSPLFGGLDNSNNVPPAAHVSANAAELLEARMLARLERQSQAHFAGGRHRFAEQELGLLIESMSQFGSQNTAVDSNLKPNNNDQLQPIVIVPPGI